jgi:hypothetical protein
MSYTTFFYDRQIRRFLTQFIRIMSNFQVQINIDQDGEPIYQRVPVFYGDASRQASQIIRGNSENAIKSVPAMAVHINTLKYDRERVQEPNFVSKMNIRTRQYDPVAEQYTDQQAGVFTVERLMPVPYRLTLKVDVWTSNTEQKLMLLEQIMLLFNPAMEIQSTDNYIDWTSLSYVLLTDIDWSNRSIPAGTEDTIDISSLTFELPIWVSAPVKIKELGVVRQIVNSVYDDNGNIDDNYLQGLNSLSGQNFTFAGYGVIYQNNYLKLLKQHELNANDVKITSEIELKQRHSWPALIAQFGKISSGISKIRLLQENNSDVVGTIAFHPGDETLLLFTPFPDTYPANTIQPITAIINPQNIDVNSNLVTPTAGTRYLLLHGIGAYGNDEHAPAWHNPKYPPLVANANDIVEFNGAYWVVTFDSVNTSKLEYVTNMTTNIQYKWNKTAWTKSVEGRYYPSNWSLTL